MARCAMLAGKNEVLKDDPFAGVSPEEIKRRSMERGNRVQSYASDCQANWDLSTIVPRDLFNIACDFFRDIFGPSSTETDRFMEYRVLYYSNDTSLRRKFVDDLCYDLISAVDRLQSLPAEYYAVNGIGVVNNQQRATPSVLRELGIGSSGSAFSKRLSELCQRTQMCLEHGCFDAGGFLLRKILEITIIERYRHDKRGAEILKDNKTLGLDALMDHARVTSKGGYIGNKIVDKLKDEKLFMDLAVHSARFDPSEKNIERIVSLIRAAFADLRIDEL